MTDRADQIIDALRTGHDRLAGLVRTLPPESLTLPSGAAQWDVSQVLSHLGSGAQIALAGLEGALNGTGVPDGDFNRSVWARWDAMTPAQRAEGFLSANETLVARYEGLDADTRKELRVDLGYLPAPVDVATAAGLRLNEFTHHAWDVQVAFDPAAALAPEATGLLLGQADLLIAFIGKTDALGGRHVAVAVHITKPQRSLGLDLGAAVALTDEPAQPDAVLYAPAEWWLRLTTGRHAPQHTPPTVVLSGDSLTLDDLRLVFPGY